MKFLSAKLHKILLKEVNYRYSSKLVNLLPENVDNAKVPLKLEHWIKDLLIDLSKYISLRKASIPYLKYDELKSMFDSGLNVKDAISKLMTMNEDSDSKKMKDFYQRAIKASDEDMNNLLSQLIDYHSQSTYKKSKDPRKKKLTKSVPRIHGDTIKDIMVSDREEGTVDSYKGIVDQNKKEFDLDKLRSMIMDRYTSNNILKQNSKALKSSTNEDDIWQIGLSALKGLVVDESDPEQNFMFVNTCPGAGACIFSCYAMKGGYIQYNGSFLRMTRLLNHLVNDPKDFEKTLIDAIRSKEQEAKSKGRQLHIRWHDSGDFFSKEYEDIAENVSMKFPNVIFYAYTKNSSSYNRLGKLDNFVTNFSREANPANLRDVDLEQAKLAKIVPKKLFMPHMERVPVEYADYSYRTDIKEPIEYKEFNKKKGKLVSKSSFLIWKTESDWKQFVSKLSKEEGIPKETIVKYDEWYTKYRNKKIDDINKRFNVVIVPKVDGDLTASRKNVRTTYLLEH
jgi:hypothetical protein